MKHENHPAFEWFERRQYGILLGTLLLVYAIFPFAGTRPVLRGVLQLALLLMMSAAIASFSRHRLAFVAAIGLGIAVQVAQVLHRFTDVSTRGIVAHTLELLFFAAIIVAIAGRLLRLERVNMNAVFGVCSIYLLIAFSWSNIFIMVEKVQPGSFKRPEVAGELGRAYVEEDNDLLYFSLITLTTVGYGDITPVTPPARTLSALEGVIGQLFVAVILARIVSMEIGDRIAAKQTRPPQEGPPAGTGRDG